MRRKHFLYSFAALIGLVAIGTGCKKFLDVNQNLNSPSPSSVNLSLVLSSAERSIANNLALGSGLGNTMAVYTHQITGRVAADRYGAGSAGWDGLYGAVSNLNVIIRRGPKEQRLTYAGIAKILKAYTFSMLVDVYGDVPYSEFDRFEEGISQPKFDKGSEIYPKLLALLDEGIADVKNTIFNVSKPSTDDYIYKGDLAKWVKAANTIKLKLYTQMRLVQDVKAQVTALLADPKSLINWHSESFMMPYGPLGTTDDRHPAYGDYTATQRGGQLFSPWLFEIMKGKNSNILTGLTDPRINYYIYNQKSATGAPENCTEYRDGGFISIIFGSNGTCRDGSNSQTYSLLGVYPAGGRYNDGNIVTVNTLGTQNAGTGALPHQFLTYTDRLYLEAELIQAGVVTGNAKTAFSKALDETFKQVDTIIINYVKPASAGAAQNVPGIATQTATDTYKAGVLAAFDAGDAAKKLEYIMTEKWIARIENPVDNYTDYRRTKFPVLFAPAPEGTVTSVTGPDGKITPVSNDRKYPLTLPFSNAEIGVNKNAPPQKVPENYKVFWLP
ncbi:SusD/RagB family nutrient-binding outer membrane lipoprotein [Paraflavitalea sp. CAU 1676]|uniref:SusD/RagB family nutrient-binding outer membrane lipoprotein n=1 Tax=Paraflavitalea sp. CAU 1676 TaxID=3032598 RepID=UPI0023DC90D1|nr:SusD/RagB family nutrient-binding outer membrane lipoprotein [Paraflavitalea sp. CAU 1676]MDF2193214.1 SusD/RagB family nutrient-binding outer membrane lipoprotein [Paraflavitalea sp. CAU 1676]